MPALAKATLEEIDATPEAKTVGERVEVQFNPQTLKLALASRVEGADSKGKQVRQWIGKSSTSLSFDLHFDTADEGTTDQPVSVRGKTAMVERFVLPKANPTEKQATPKVRFQWSDLIFDGLIESLNVDFDLFASNGTPLRAKMSVTIKEQDAKYELGKSGPSANTAGNALLPGQISFGPGSVGASLGGGAGASFDLSAAALDGESAADFLVRNGVDPAAWRGVAAQVGGGLSLQGGVEVGFNADFSVSAGVGVSVGVEAGTRTSLEGAFGLRADPGQATSAGVALGGASSAGFALAAAGGVSAAIETVAATRTQSAAAAARRAFDAPAPPPRSVSSTVAAPGIRTDLAQRPAPVGAALPAPERITRPSLPEQPRSPLRLQGPVTSASSASTPSAPPPPRADVRAVAFGFGVPLRPRVGAAAELRTGALASRIPLRPHGRAADVLEPADPTLPPWTRLPPDRVRAKADGEQQRNHPARPCGCGGGCRRCCGGAA